MKILGTGSALPSLSVTNEMLSTFLDTNDEWISTRTGIKERRIISDETLLELAVTACINAIENAQITAQDLDFIICSNVVNNFVTPALSCIIQGKIEAKCPCIDLNGACTGFIFALDMAEAYIATGRAKNILIICAEEPSKIVDWQTRDASILFGDGAGAVVVSAGNNLKSIRLTTTCSVEPLYYRRQLEHNPYNQETTNYQPLVMCGKDVYKLAVSSATSDIRKVLDDAQLHQENIDYYLLHQANLRIIDTIREYLHESAEKFQLNVQKYGNTSSASIPILLDEMNREQKLNRGDLLVLSAFGAGFTSGACVLEW